MEFSIFLPNKVLNQYLLELIEINIYSPIIEELSGVIRSVVNPNQWFQYLQVSPRAESNKKSPLE